MDLLPLDKDTFYPTDIFEEYRSLIWTERFDDSGEFQLISANVKKAIEKFPLGTLVSLRDTTEVMMVETHSIEPSSSDDLPEITISGRTLDAFLEHRILVPIVYGEDWETLKKYTPAQFLCLLLWNALANDSEEDPTKTWTRPAYCDPNLAVPNLVISLGSINNIDSPQTWTLSAGVVRDFVIDIQNAYKLGIKAVRPTLDRVYDYNRVSFDISNQYTRGTFDLDYISGDTQNLRLEVYQGTDRTINQSKVTPVVFHQASGHIVDPKYLMSNQNAKTYAVAVSSEDETEVFLGTREPGIGFARRDLYIDGGSSRSDALSLIAEIELQKQGVFAMADGEISHISPYLYGRDYFLGDVLTFSSNYKSNTSMFINEIVRTEDLNGEILSPGIINYDEIDVIEPDDEIIG
jgi:hypothetical protein